MVAVVFVHGAGKAGADAWPVQAARADPGHVFLDRHRGGDSPSRDAGRVLALLRASGGGHVVAHSYGANAAVLASQREPDLVRSLALLEPACFDLARGMPAVEAHVADMTPVFAVADDASVPMREFSRRFVVAMGFPPDPSDSSWSEEDDVRVSRLRELRPPWGLGLRPELCVPTLVLTGGARPLYDETAAALVALGARHRMVGGAGHRVQDDPRTTGILRGLWRG